MNTQSANFVNRTPVFLLAILAVSTGISCAVAPDTDSAADTRPLPAVTSGTSAVNAPYAMYEKRDFAGAAASYEAVAGDSTSGNEARRLAYLGNALVHLSTDPQLRDLDKAGQFLQSAEAVETENENVETSMLMNALSSLIGVESNISELNSKTSNSSAEIARLKEERDTLQAELTASSAEQAALNEALEKLKALTIGN